MKWLKRFKQEPWFNYAMALCIAILFYILIERVGWFVGVVSSFFSIISPLIVGVVIAYIINPLANLIERLFMKMKLKEKVAWVLAVVFAVILAIGIIAAIASVFVPQLITSISSFISNLDVYINDLVKLLNSKGLGEVAEKIQNLDFGSAVSQISSAISGDALLATSKTVGGAVTNFFIGFILAVYYLIDKKNLQRVASKLFESMLQKKYAFFASFCESCNSILIRYISYSILEAIMVGIANAIFMAIMQMPYIGIVSVVVGVTNLAPTFGPIVGGIIGGFILLLAEPMDVVYFIIFTLILQTIDGYIVKPKLFSGTLGISSLLVLVSIIVLGKMFGVAGILLSIPLAAIVQYLVIELSKLKQEKAEAERKEKEVHSQE